MSQHPEFLELIGRSRSDFSDGQTISLGDETAHSAEAVAEQADAAQGDKRAEYDFDYSKAVRGKYYRRLLKEGANVVVLDPDVAKAFRSSAAVNETLRSLLKMSEATRRLTSRSSGRASSARC